MQLCPACRGKTEVTDSRPQDDVIRRRRRCTVCGKRFTTIEIRLDELDKLRRQVALPATVSAMRQSVERAVKGLTAFARSLEDAGKPK